MTEISVPSVTLNDDREMPLIGLGTWKLRDQECERAVREAIEVGYRKFDTAALYKNEEAVGKALRDAIAAGDVTRDEIFVTTKLWHDHHGAERAAVGFQESIDRLGLDYVDLYMIHWPWPQGGKYVETFEAIARLQGMGQIASIGVANFYEEVLQELIDRVGITPAVNQVELHVGFTQPELQAFHRAHGIVTEAWAPLGRGSVLDDAAVTAVARELGVTAGQAALGFLLAQGISVVPKSARRERLEENLRAGAIELSRDQTERLGALTGAEGYGRLSGDPREFPGAEG